MTRNLLKIIPLCGLLISTSVKAEINMAVIAPMAGELKSFGDELVSGVRIAVNDINAQGGLHGERINLVTIDDRCEDVFEISTAQMLAVNSSKATKMNVVIGPYCSNSFKEVSDIYAKANIFQIIPTAVSNSNAKMNHSGLVKMLGSSERQGLDFYRYYKDNFDGQKTAMVYDSGMRGIVEIAAAVQDEFHKDGKGQVFQLFNFNDYGTDMSSMASDILRQEMKVAYILGSPKKVAKLSKALKRQNTNFTTFTNRYQMTADYEDIIGDYAEGTYAFALPSLKDNPAFTETLVRLRLTGAEPEGLGVYGYSAVNLWAELVDKAGSLRYAQLAKALKENTFETAWGEMMFTNGNPNNEVDYGVYQMQSGEYTQVY